MRHSFATRFAIAATLALGQSSIIYAGSSFDVATSDGQQAPGAKGHSSIKVVSPPAETKQPQSEVAQRVVPSPDEAPPVAEPSLPAGQARAPIIELLPGYLTPIKFEWNIRDVHIGDPNVIDVIPVGSTTVLVQGKTAGRTNFYVTSSSGNEEMSREVIVRSPLVGKAVVHNVEIHNNQKLGNYTMYECINFDCVNAERHEIQKEDLPRGYTSTNENVEQRVTNKTAQ